jgi:hypothetical protein
MKCAIAGSVATLLPVVRHPFDGEVVAKCDLILKVFHQTVNVTTRGNNNSCAANVLELAKPDA